MNFMVVSKYRNATKYNSGISYSEWFLNYKAINLDFVQFVEEVEPANTDEPESYNFFMLGGTICNVPFDYVDFKRIDPRDEGIV